jgi:hypothetical protein
LLLLLLVLLVLLWRLRHVCAIGCLGSPAWLLLLLLVLWRRRQVVVLLLLLPFQAPPVVQLLIIRVYEVAIGQSLVDGLVCLRCVLHGPTVLR